MQLISRAVALPLAALLLFGASHAHSVEVVRVGFIEVLSGPFGAVGNASLNQLREVAAQLNEKSGAKTPKLEIVPFDGKGTPQESANALLAAKNQGIRYITQGGGSGVAYALVDGINKVADRDPNSSILFLNYAAMDAGLTNEKCSFWHFRFYPSASMQIRGLAGYIGRSGKARKVYLLNQAYSMGQQVSRDARMYLKVAAPGVEIVGEDFVPLAQVKDFAPYIAKAKSSGADAVITSNWGSDLGLLLKSAKSFGSDMTFFTLNSTNAGIATQLGDWGANKIATVGDWSQNADTPELEKILVSYKKKHGEDFTYASHWNGMAMLLAAIEKAGSTDPKKVAFSLEDMKLRTPSGEIVMRAQDHQLQAPMYLSFWAKQGTKGVKYDMENTGFGFRTEEVWAPKESTLPTTCEMKRPAR